MQTIPLACLFSMLRPPGIEFENAALQAVPVNKDKCQFIRDTNDITFQLYTRHNPTVYQELKIGDDEALFASNINFNDRTVFVLHGFMEIPNDGSMLLLREAYILRGDTNVILVNSQRLEAGPWYITASENTWYIGRFTAALIDYLVSRGLDLDKTHLVGHSLGAQSAGVAGSSIRTGRIARITGLDPALPLFKHVPLALRLDPSDAKFVDVIHTDAGIFGYNKPVGHVDFWPNGGISPQPGCQLHVVIPEQLILRTCDNKTLGYYTIQLQANRQERTKLERNIVKLFEFIHTVKSQDKTNFARNNVQLKQNLYEDTQITHTENNIHTDKIDKRNKIQTHIKDVHNKKQITKKYAIKKKTTNKYDKGQYTEAANDNEHIPEPTKQTPDNFKYLIPETDTKTHVIKREKRFVSFFRKDNENDNFIFRMLDFLVKNRKNVLPVLTVMKEINTLVKSANGEISHISKERNNYVGATPLPIPLTYNLELGGESKLLGMLKRLVGLTPKGDRLTVTGK